MIKQTEWQARTISPQNDINKTNTRRPSAPTPKPARIASSIANTRRPAAPSRRHSNRPSSTGQSQTTKAQPATTINDFNKVKIMVLGGLEEVGRNMTLIEYNKEIIIIDMGLQFPEEDMPGIDYIIPNVTYLEGKEDWIKGVIITHGHMDHIGAIPHLMGKIGNPTMFMGKLTAGLVQKRVEENRSCPKLKIQEITEESKVRLGNGFNIEFLRVNHSIPDCFAIIVKTPAGTIIHTGDFKIDFSPVNDKPADLNRIAQIGANGIELLMSDSTDAISPGYQVSESAIGDEMDKIFDNVEGRIIIGTFASQLSRVQKLFDIAAKFGRRVYLQGRSMNNNVEIAHKIGYLKFNSRILLNDAELKKIPDNKLVVIGTGAQGESNAFLMRLANNEHRLISLKRGDTVVFSSSVIPGNERSIQSLKDMIVKQGAKIVHYKMMDVHAGGHAKQEDLKLMMRLLKPKYLMPIEANHFMLRAHAELGEQIGIPTENIFVAENGQVVEMEKKGTESIAKMTTKKIPADYVMVDGLGVGDISNIVLRDRRMMSEDGMIVIIATIRHKTGELVGNPDIISRGFVYMKESKGLIEQTRKKVKTMLNDTDKSTVAFENYIKDKIRNDIGQFLFSKTKRRPMVLPVIIQV